MSLNNRYVATLLLVLFLLPAALWAQDGPISRRLGIGQGLSNNSVRCIYQDHHGFMWLGTYDGLNRYDGYQFKIFRNQLDDTGSLPHNYINTIHEDGQHNLWVATGQGVGIYSNLTGRFRPAYYLRDNKEKLRIGANVDALASDAAGNVFIGTSGWGLMVCYKGKDAALPVSVEGKFAFGADIGAIKVDQKQRIWIGIRGLGLGRLDAVRRQVRLVKPFRQGIYCMETDDRENLWIGTDEGLYQYHIPTGTLLQAYREGAGQLTHNKVASLCFDRRGQLWIGTEGGGLNILDTRTGKMEYLLPGESKNALSSESVFSVYEDREGRKWLGTLKGGINIIDPWKPAFPTIVHDPLNANSLINNFVSSFCEDRQGNLYIGTDGGGLSIWNRRQNTFANFRHEPGNPASLSNNLVNFIRMDHRGSIWVATYGGGIDKFDPASRSFHHYRCVNGLTGTENKNSCLILEDHNGELWATTFIDGKLYRLNRAADCFEVFDQKLFDGLALMEDRSGVLWGGNTSQLVKVDRTGHQHAYYEIGKPVRALYEDQKGRLWIGTEGGGLILFDRQQGKISRRYSTAEGLCNNSVLTILEDEKGHLWLSTFNGLSEFDPARQTFKNYYQEDGLQSNQFLYNAALRLRSGEFAFGGIGGFNLFYPDSIHARHGSLPVLITGLRINNLPVVAASPYVTRTKGDEIAALRIPYDEGLSVDFAAPEYSAPGKIAYAYYLEGWDRNWNFSGDGRTANYSHLHEGNYALHIKSTEVDGSWNPRKITLYIVVLPPWYRSWWAYGLYLLLAVLLIHFLVRSYHRGMEEKNRRKFELLEMAKQKEILEVELAKEKELLQAKLEFFTNVAHEIRTPLTLIKVPLAKVMRKAGNMPELENSLRIMQRNTARLVDLTNQLLDFRKTESNRLNLSIENADISALVAEACAGFTSLTEQNNIRLFLSLPETPFFAFVDVDVFHKIIYNVFGNAVKYAASGVEIELLPGFQNDSSFTIRVKNDGHLIPEALKEKIFEPFFRLRETEGQTGTGIGLALSRSLAQLHGGVLELEPPQGERNVFALTLPVQQACEPLPADKTTGGVPYPEVNAR